MAAAFFKESLPKKLASVELLVEELDEARLEVGRGDGGRGTRIWKSIVHGNAPPGRGGSE